MANISSADILKDRSMWCAVSQQRVLKGLTQIKQDYWASVRDKHFVSQKEWRNVRTKQSVCHPRNKPMKFSVRYM